MTTDEQCAAIAREWLGETIGVPLDQKDIDDALWFAARITAIRVKSTGATTERQEAVMTPGKPTPRTDAFASSRYDDRPPEWLDFARQFERELIETKEKLAIAMRFAETRLENINILTQKIP